MSEYLNKSYSVKNYGDDATSNCSLILSGIANLINSADIFKNLFRATYSSDSSTTTIYDSQSSPWKNLQLILKGKTGPGYVNNYISVTLIYKGRQVDTRWNMFDCWQLPFVLQAQTLFDDGILLQFNNKGYSSLIIFSKAIDTMEDNKVVPIIIHNFSDTEKYLYYLNGTNVNAQISPPRKQQLQTNNPDCYRGDNIGLSSVVTVMPFKQNNIIFNSLYYYDGGESLIPYKSNIGIGNTRFCSIVSGSNILLKIATESNQEEN